MLKEKLIRLKESNEILGSLLSGDEMDDITTIADMIAYRDKVTKTSVHIKDITHEVIDELLRKHSNALLALGLYPAFFRAYANPEEMPPKIVIDVVFCQMETLTS